MTAGSKTPGALVALLAIAAGIALSLYFATAVPEVSLKQSIAKAIPTNASAAAIPAGEAKTVTGPTARVAAPNAPAATAPQEISPQQSLKTLIPELIRVMNDGDAKKMLEVYTAPGLGPMPLSPDLAALLPSFSPPPPGDTPLPKLTAEEKAQLKEETAQIQKAFDEHPDAQALTAEQISQLGIKPPTPAQLAAAKPGEWLPSAWSQKVFDLSMAETIRPQMKPMAEMLASIGDASPTLNDDGTQATYKVIVPPGLEPPGPEEAPDTLTFIKVNGLWYLENSLIPDGPTLSVIKTDAP